MLNIADVHFLYLMYSLNLLPYYWGPRTYCIMGGVEWSGVSLDEKLHLYFISFITVQTEFLRV